MLWCRWRYGGEDALAVYRRYNGPNARVPPPYPERLETVLDGFAMYAHEQQIKLAKGRL